MAVEGQTLQRIADELCISPYTFFQARQHDPVFNQEFMLARQEGINTCVDRLDTIHEEHPDPQVMRVVSDNIKWKASKLNPAIYGDRLDLNVNHTVDIGGALKEAKQRASFRSLSGGEEDTNIIDITQVDSGQALELEGTRKLIDIEAEKTTDAIENSDEDIWR